MTFKITSILALFLLLFTAAVYPQETHQKFYISLTQENVDATNMGVKPGDTVCIMAGLRRTLRLVNFQGDSLHYVTFINKGGVVEINSLNNFFGIQVLNCAYFRFTGTGLPCEKFGIKITRTAPNSNGLSLDGNSTNYEVDHLEICNTGFAGICANPKPDCDDKLNRGNFTQRNTTYHDNYIHNTYGEGFYVGHSFYSGYTISCGDSTRLVYPHELKGVRIYNNVMDSTGFDGIQVGCATSDCEIYGNSITHYGARNEKNQNFGIIIGSGTTGKCYSNTIINGTGNGINVFGIGNNFIYNNIIINPGHPLRPDMLTSDAIGIFCDDRNTVPGSSFYFLNNTIISAKGDGLRLQTTVSRNNVVANNIILNPGSYGNYRDPNQCFVNLAAGVDASVLSNYCSGTLTPYLKHDYIPELFEFCNTLPVIDQGIDVTSYGISTDYFGKDRKINNSCDIGAFEFETPAPQKQKSSSIKIVSKVNDGELYIYSTKKDLIENVSIFHLTGKLIYNNNLHDNDVSITMKDKFERGIYIVRVSTDSEEYRDKISLNY